MAPNNALKLTGKPIFVEHVSHENNTVDNTSNYITKHTVTLVVALVGVHAEELKHLVKEWKVCVYSWISLRPYSIKHYLSPKHQNSNVPIRPTSCL